MAKGGRPLYRRAVFWGALGLPVLLLLWVGLLWITLPDTAGPQIDLDTFQSWVQAGEVQKVVLLDADARAVVFRDDQANWLELSANALYVNGFLERLDLAGVPVEIDQQSIKTLLQPATYAVPALMLVLAVLLTFGMMRSGGGAFVRSAARRGEGDDPVTFDDVAGADDAIEEIREVRDYLVAPERFAEIGAEPPRGILLDGPPGTGKTLLARACAGEAGVPFFSISGSDFNEMYVGVGAARVRDLFRRVRDSAPAILFIDEIDAMGRIRGVQGQDERDQTLNQLLVELDGFHNHQGVVLIGATNRPDVLDPALLRRGRFDRRIVIERPDREARTAILAVHARRKQIGPDVDLNHLATATPGFTGADLASVLNEAALLAARQPDATIGRSEIDRAIERVQSGSQGHARLLTDREKHTVACHEVGHAVVRWSMPDDDRTNRLSIMAGCHRPTDPTADHRDERFVVDQAQLEDRLTVMMAGRAAEEVATGQPASSSKPDLRKASMLARRMVCEYGMSELLGRRSLGWARGSEHLDDTRIEPDWSAEVAVQIDREIARLLDQAFHRAAVVVRANRMTFDRVVALLVEHESLGQAELAGFADEVAVATPPPSARRV